MRRFIVRGLLSAALLMLAATAAFAWHIEGYVYCEGTGDALSGVDIHVVNQGGDAFDETGTTDGSGYYFIELLNTPNCYRATVVLGANETAVTPASGYYDFCTTDSDFEITRDFTIDSPRCGGQCWLTGGGAKYSVVTGTNLGQAKTTSRTI